MYTVKKLSTIDTKKQINAIWFTGIPASGKTTIANALGNELKKLEQNFYILDGDNLRSTINKGLGFSKEDRFENIRRTAHIAKILLESNVIPIISTISPYADSRAHAKEIIGKENFVEVFVKASLEICVERDPKNLYNNSKEKNKKYYRIA